MNSSKHRSVLIVGAGLSGIGAAYHLQTLCPGRSYEILEARETLGGTWDLFRYPGIRSDSDMYTLGYSFRPWKGAKAIADGPSILAYLRETAEAYGIDQKIRYGQRVERARWSSEDARWTLDVRDGATGEVHEWTCDFLYVCAGYYRYERGYTPTFEGVERFRGRIVHPQQWTDDVAWEGRRVVVIGSGATAVTLVPELAKKAAHVTMLQRSPTYIVSRPAQDALANWLRERLPSQLAYDLTRWKNVVAGSAFYALCRRFPAGAGRLIVKGVEQALGDRAQAKEHFTPRYAPWDQRLCLVPDGDLFEALRAGRASVVTDTIETFTEGGIRLSSGRELEADLVVTATGLALQLMGGISLEVDGRAVEPAKTLTYKGMMCSDVPNLAFAIGYTNASWTLKCDLTSQFVCRLLNHMDARGLSRCVPRNLDPAMPVEPLIDFSSGYVQRAADHLPKQGARAPWKLYQNYLLDTLSLRHGAVTDPELELSGARSSGERG
jgi:monooxygenase